jgi:hypothetical protein
LLRLARSIARGASRVRLALLRARGRRVVGFVRDLAYGRDILRARTGYRSQKFPALDPREAQIPEASAGVEIDTDASDVGWSLTDYRGAPALMPPGPFAGIRRFLQ